MLYAAVEEIPTTISAAIKIFFFVVISVSIREETRVSFKKGPDSFNQSHIKNEGKCDFCFEFLSDMS